MSYKTGAELTEEARGQIREVSPKEVKAMLESKEDVTYLDVREPNEWNLGRIPGAVHLPRGNLESKLEGMVDRDRKIVVYCARGNRSALAALTMKEMGYENVMSMSGGFQSWPDVGGSIEE
jgi:sulfur-carrier protein adenylyltransferase/sulfurtransferase